MLFFTDPLDELWLRLPREFEGKPLVSAAKGDVTPASEDEKKQGDEQRREQEEGFKDLLLVLRAKLQDHVKDVRLSSRLTSSAACLVGDEGDLSPRMAEMFRRTGQEVPVVKRVLELNPDAPAPAEAAGDRGARPDRTPRSRSTPSCSTGRPSWPKAASCPTRPRSASASRTCCCAWCDGCPGAGRCGSASLT